MEKVKAQMIAKDLMRFYQLNNWQFRFDRSVRRFGYCRPRSKIISLSEYLVSMNNETEVLDTVLHEIAHALTPNCNHGYKWVQMAKSIGCTGNRYYFDDVVTPKKPLKGVCPICGYTIQRFRQRRLSCGRCSPKFDVTRLFVWSQL